MDIFVVPLVCGNADVLFLGGSMLILCFILACATKEQDVVSSTIESDVSGYITSLLGAGGVEDVTVCAADCTTTDESGFYILQAQNPSSDWSLHMTGDDLVSGIVPFVVSPPAQELPNISLVSPTLIDAQMNMVDLTWEENTGILAFSFSNGIFGDGINVPNISISMTEEQGSGPFYTNEQGLPSSAFVETTSHGGGVWVNIPAGTHTFETAGLPTGCTLLLGWGNVEQVHIPIVENHITFLRIECLEE